MGIEMKSSKKQGVEGHINTVIDAEMLQLLDMIDKATKPSTKIERMTIKVCS
jgi:hypothetical protein